MGSLVGHYLLCTVAILVHIPHLKETVEQKEEFKCQVIDDVFMSVGSSDSPQYPMIIDCSKDRNFKMLAPKNAGIFLTYKGESCEL
jgi:hypothetical protein